MCIYPGTRHSFKASILLWGLWVFFTMGKYWNYCIFLPFSFPLLFLWGFALSQSLRIHTFTYNSVMVWHTWRNPGKIIMIRTTAQTLLIICQSRAELRRRVMQKSIISWEISSNMQTFEIWVLSSGFIFQLSSQEREKISDSKYLFRSLEKDFKRPANKVDLRSEFS